MESTKLVGSTLSNNCKLSKDQCPKSKNEKVEMSKVPYASVGGSLMYAMVCTRSDIVYAVRVISRYMSKISEERKSRKRALGCSEMDALVSERHLERVPPIRLR